MAFISVPAPPFHPGSQGSRGGGSFVGVNTQSSPEDTAMLFGMLNLLSQNRATQFGQELALRQFQQSEDLQKLQKEGVERQGVSVEESLASQQAALRFAEIERQFAEKQQAQEDEINRDIRLSRNRFTEDLTAIRRNASLYQERGDNVYRDRLIDGLNRLVPKAMKAINSSEDDFERAGVAQAVKEALATAGAFSEASPFPVEVRDKVQSYVDQFAPVLADYGPESVPILKGRAFKRQETEFASSLAAQRAALGNTFAGMRTSSPKEFASRAASLVGGISPPTVRPLNRKVLSTFEPVPEAAPLPPREGVFERAGSSLSQSKEALGKYLFGDPAPVTNGQFTPFTPPLQSTDSLGVEAFFRGDWLPGKATPSVIEVVPTKTRAEYESQFNQGDSLLDALLGKSQPLSPYLQQVTKEELQGAY